MKNLFLSLLTFALAAGFTSCDSNSHFAKEKSSVSGWNYNHSDTRAYDDAYASSGNSSGIPSLNPGNEAGRGALGGDKLEEKDQNVTDRMINYSASVSLDVKNSDSVTKRVVAVAKKYEGYMTSSGSTYVTISVKSSHFQEALNEIYTFGKVSSKNISGQDVTDQFTDLKVRLDNANRTRARYLELLNKAANVTEMVSIERELERLNLDIDRLTGSLNKLQHENDYSSITVYAYKKKKPGVVGYVFVGLYKGVKWLFVRG